MKVTQLMWVETGVKQMLKTDRLCQQEPDLRESLKANHYFVFDFIDLQLQCARLFHF